MITKEMLYLITAACTHEHRGDITQFAEPNILVRDGLGQKPSHAMNSCHLACTLDMALPMECTRCVCLSTFREDKLCSRT